MKRRRWWAVRTPHFLLITGNWPLTTFLSRGLGRRRKKFVGRASVPIYDDLSPLYKGEIFCRYFAGFLLKCRKAEWGEVLAPH